MESAMELARRRVGDALYEALLRRSEPARPSLILHAVPAEVGVGPGAAREVLDSDARFVAIEGRYDLRLRAEPPGGGFNASLERVITEYGAPLDIALLAQFFAGMTDRDTEYYLNLISRLCERRDLFLALGHRLLPASWVLVPEGHNEDDVLFYCGLDTDEELLSLRPACARDELRGADPLATAANVVRAAGAPISNRALGFFVYRLHPEKFDALDLLRGMLEDERVHALPGLRWVVGEMRDEIGAALRELDAAHAGARPAVSVDLEPVLGEPLPPEHPGYFIEDDDLRLIYEVLETSAKPVSVADLLLEVLELEPDHPQFIPAAHSVHDLLRDDPAIMQVSPATFVGPGAVPQWVKDVPAALVPVAGKPGEDVILREEGLRPGLADKIHDPFLEDIGDDDVALTPDVMTSDETFYTLSFPHRIAGTMKLRKMDAEFFAVAAPVAPIQALDPGGHRHDAWANTDTGLLLGLGDLYAHLDLMPGAVIAVTPGERAGEFVFDMAGQDEASSIDEARLEWLLQMRERAERTGASLYEAVRELMASAGGTMRFDTLHAQVNVIRRTTRLQLASLLSYYQCFRPKDGQGDVWAFAPEAVAAGAVATKQKFVIRGD